LVGRGLEGKGGKKPTAVLRDQSMLGCKNQCRKMEKVQLRKNRMARIQKKEKKRKETVVETVAEVQKGSRTRPKNCEHNVHIKEKRMLGSCGGGKKKTEMLQEHSRGGKVPGGS